MEELNDPILFSNPSVDLASLPTATSLDWQSLAPAYYQLNLARAGFAALILLLFIVGFTFANGMQGYSLTWIITLPVWAVISLFQFWIAARRFAAEAYSLRERDILHRKGVLIQMETIVPFNRVQHVSIKRGPLEKYFGLASLNIFTAGGQSSDLEISGLPAERANELKDFIAEKTGKDVTA